MDQYTEESFNYLLKLDKDILKGMTFINEYHKEILRLRNKIVELGEDNLPNYEAKSINILFKKNLLKNNLNYIFFMIYQYTKARSDILDIIFYQQNIRFQLENILRKYNHKRKLE